MADGKSPETAPAPAAEASEQKVVPATAVVTTSASEALTDILPASHWAQAPVRGCPHYQPDATSRHAAYVSPNNRFSLTPICRFQLPEVPPRDDDADSMLGDDAASSTASLTAPILEYRTIHGRTYHSELGKAQSWYGNGAWA
jgi:hypothetical protein